jgi:predicted aminopeptidase
MPPASRFALAATRLALALGFSGALAGCGNALGAGYLTQAAEGQFWLLRSARPIPEVTADEATPARTRTMLSEVASIKHFGEDQGLTPTKNYETYVDVKGPAVTWVVSACEPLAFRPRSWNFPIVGNITYVGWFDVADARAHAARLKEQGLDVDLRGASAYSTLGWLRDPILSSMLAEGDGALGGLVDVVIHESVHATYYLKGQSFLNESLASFIAPKLTHDYLARTRGPDAPELAAYQRAEALGDEHRKALHEVYLALEKLYASAAPTAEKLEKKAKILADVQAQLRLRRPLNNAVLVQYRTYDTSHDDLEALFAACGKSWPRFWTAMRALDLRSFVREQQADLHPVLVPLQGHCGPG